MNIIVDTNIIFSAILSSNGKIGELLLNKPVEVHYLSPKFSLGELDFHTEKIIRLTGFTEPEYQEVKAYVIQHIEFVDSNTITLEHWQQAYHLLEGADENDIPFLALSLHVNGLLWTGDKKLIKALQHKRFDHIVTTDIIYLKYFGLQ